MVYAYARKEGKIRLIHLNAHDQNMGTIVQWRTLEFPGDVASATGVITNHTDPQKLPKLIKKALGEIGGNILEKDDKLALEFCSDADPGDATAVLMASKSYVRMPVTVQNARTRAPPWEDCYGIADINYTVDTKKVEKGTFVPLSKLTIPAQERLKLGINVVDVRAEGAYSMILVERTGSA